VKALSFSRTNPLDRNKIRSSAVLGRLAPEIPPTGSCFFEAIRSVSEL
jgi:hypothetical protein